MSSVASFVAGAFVSLMVAAFISAIDYSRHESFKLDWCESTSTGHVLKYDEQVCRQMGKNTCGYKETVHVVKRQSLIVCKKLRWE